MRAKFVYIFIVIPLFASMLVLSFANDSEFASSATGEEFGDSCQCEEKKYEESETIYSKIDCVDCSCEGAGKKLFAFHGTDANCEDKSTETERYLCYNKYSYATYQCEQYTKASERNKCWMSHPGFSPSYFLGPSGTFVNNYSVMVGGRRTYLLGFDREGKHEVNAGAIESARSALTIRGNSRDLEIDGSLGLSGRENGNIIINSPDGGLYFGTDVEFASFDIDEDHEGVGVVEGNRGTGIEKAWSPSEGDSLIINANYQKMIESDGETNKIMHGVEIENRLRVEDEFRFQGQRLRWSAPIRGDFILYY